MVAMEMGKKGTIAVIIATVTKKVKYSSKIWIFYIQTTTDKTELTG